MKFIRGRLLPNQITYAYSMDQGTLKMQFSLEYIDFSFNMWIHSVALSSNSFSVIDNKKIKRHRALHQMQTEMNDDNQ